MEAKSNKRGKRVHQNAEWYVDRTGRKLPFMLLPGNVPRIVGKRNKGDERFLSTNRLSILQRFFNK